MSTIQLVIKMANSGQNREKFVALAEKRTLKAIQAISIIGNLSNKSNYSYTEDDVKKIRKALLDEVNVTMNRFNASSGTIKQFDLS
ncbi:MAG: hypothetical protein NTZ23_05195 [Cyanobium sp. LacPavin_0920_WC12_MAG_63_22]|nr:hypothetical protein [Cyanobium sp. LacPavin_0920_WC12_MAG_63_22]